MNLNKCSNCEGETVSRGSIVKKGIEIFLHLCTNCGYMNLKYSDRKVIIVLKGLPGSGKTTYAKQLTEEFPDKFIRVNRDDLRNMCGKYWVPKREYFITILEKLAVEEALKNGYSVILDATNFNPKVINWVEKLSILYSCEIQETFLDTPLDVCISRDLKRERSVGKDVILKMHNKYLDY